MTNGKVSVRYMVDNVDQALDFYAKHFGFEVGHNASPAFAEVSKGNLRLLLAGPESSAGRPMPDGRAPIRPARDDPPRCTTAQLPPAEAPALATRPRAGGVAALISPRRDPRPHGVRPDVVPVELEPEAGTARQRVLPVRAAEDEPHAIVQLPP